jgi:1-acyl-sn-glycerol-3-phosphate acyltransferase
MASGTASKTVNDSTSNERPPSQPWTARDVVQIVLFALLVKPFMTLFIGLRVRGREHLPRTGQFILVANHSSHLDTVSLLTLFRLTRLRHIRPVAAADYFERNALVSLLTKTVFNILPIARQGITAENNPVERMQQALAAGQSLIIFPEGTRGTGERIGPFRSGIARLIAKLPEVPVVPAYLANMGRSLPKGEIIPVPFFCEIRLGEPLLLSGDRQQIIHTLEEAVRGLKEK